MIFDRFHGGGHNTSDDLLRPLRGQATAQGSVWQHTELNPQQVLVGGAQAADQSEALPNPIILISKMRRWFI